MAVRGWLLFLGSIACAGLVTAAPVDDTLDNDGKWRARVEGDASTAREGRVVISEWAGQWQEIGPRRTGDPCRGAKPFPITVQKSTKREVELTVWAASVKPACPDFALELRVVDARTLTGTTSDGRRVRLTREPAKSATGR